MLLKISKSNRVIVALWVLLFVNYLDRVAISFAGPAMMKDLSLNPSQFGIILSSFGLGYMLAQLPGGLIADRWGAKPVMILGPLLWALFTGITGLISTLSAFMVVRFCFGASEGISVTSFYKLTAEHFDARQRARAFGIINTALTLVPAVSGVMVAALVAGYGWRAMFFVMMAPAMLAALVTYHLVPTAQIAPETENTDAETSFRQVMRRPSLWLLAVSQFGFNFVSWAYSGWMPSYLAMSRGIELKSLGWLASIPYLFAFLGLLIGGWLGTRWYRYRPHLVVGAYVAVGLSLYLAYQSATLEMAMVGLCASAFLLYGALGPKGALMLDLAPERYRASYMGVISTAGQIGGALAPAVVGYLVHRTGSFASGFGLMIVAVFVASASLVALIRSRPLAGHLEAGAR